MEPINNETQTVLVTGGSGYLGLWTILTLLKQGYRVRTTVRSLARESEVRAVLAKHTDAVDRLSFFAADLMSDIGWDHATDGSDYVLHIASPMGAGDTIIAPAREGTLRVLKASTMSGVKRVVVTSSGVTARPSGGEAKSGPSQAINESVWTDLTEKGINTYTQAKTLAERAAWDFIAESGGVTTLATVLPVFIQGPVLGKDFVSDSVGVVARLLNGKLPGLPRIGFNIVDVRDVVDLHLKAMVHPDAAGQRFIASSDFMWMADMARLLRERLGSRAAKVPARRVPDFMLRLSAPFSPEARFVLPQLGLRREFTSAKAEEMLGWHARPVIETVIDCAESLIQERLV